MFPFFLKKKWDKKKRKKSKVFQQRKSKVFFYKAETSDKNQWQSVIVNQNLPWYGTFWGSGRWQIIASHLYNKTIPFIWYNYYPDGILSQLKVTALTFSPVIFLKKVFFLT